jgi:hypothetical protein
MNGILVLSVMLCSDESVFIYDISYIITQSYYCYYNYCRLKERVATSTEVYNLEYLYTMCVKCLLSSRRTSILFSV